MNVDLTPFSDDDAILRGLTDGTLERFGGTIRETATGRVVRHLVEAPTSGSRPSYAPAARLSPLEFLPDELVERALDLAQLPDAAGVLNLGVSLAGFGYMAYRLNQVEQLLSEGLADTGRQLENLAAGIGYVAMLVRAGLFRTDGLAGDVAELRRSTLVEHLAKVQSSLLHHERFPDLAPTPEALREVSASRMVLADQALRPTPGFSATPMLLADVAARGWAAGVVLEAQLLSDLGRASDARQLLADEHARFRAFAERWAGALLDDRRDAMRTAYRFTAPRLREQILAERVSRIARISPYDQNRTPEQVRRARREVEIEMQMSHNAALGDAWDQEQCARAEYLDTLSELEARLWSIGDFAREVARHGVNPRTLFETKQLHPGRIYLIAMRTE